MRPVVYLVGAGCGGPELLTIKAERLLRICDCVVYDDLIDNAVLSLVPDSAEKIYVGKRKGSHSKNQEEINSILLACADSHKCIVRLKGGDPFVFGRGGEEAAFLRENNILCREIPGITSPIAIPAEYGIPVTSRGFSDSLHIVTGHSAGDEDRLDYRISQLCDMEGTVIFLMAVSKLEEIVSAFIRHGKSPDTPIAVLSGGNSRNHYCVRSTLSGILDEVRDKNVSSPGIILVGRTASLDAGVKTPVTVALTGTKTLNDKLSKGFSLAGIDTVTFAEAGITPTSDGSEINDILRRHEPVVVFTSANGVDVFFSNMKKQRIDSRELSEIRFAVIGAATESRLEEHGYFADFMPSHFTSVSLADYLISELPQGTGIFLYRSAQADTRLADRLSASFEVSDIRAYSVNYSFNSPGIKPDYVCFASSSAVKSFSEHFTASLPKAVLIGEVTEKTFRNIYGDNYILSESISAESMVEAVIRDSMEL